MIDSVTDIKNRCEKVQIYGAGKRGSRFLNLLDYYGLKKMVQCFLVSDGSQNPIEKEGIPVKPVSEGEKRDDGKTLTIIAVADTFERRRIADFLIDCGYQFFEFLSDKIYEEQDFDLTREYFREQESRALIERLPWEEPGFCHVRIPDQTGNDFYQWRYYYLTYTEVARQKKPLFPKGELLESFEKSYGTYWILSKEVKPYLLKNGEAGKNRVCVFMTRHVGDRYEIKADLPKWVIPIQVGAALTEERIYEKTDAEGENISAMNRDFSECTAIYWIWKNVEDADYVGLFHYPRHMIISDEEIAALNPAGIDIVATTPMFSGGSIRDFFVPRYIFSHDWDLMEDAIHRHFPAYGETLEDYHAAFCYPGANLTIMRKRIYDEYAEFCFTVMQDVTDFYKERNIIRQDRYAGYLMENLTAIFVMHHKDDYKICYTDFKYLKPV